jgi:hypothetical protein
MRMMSPDEVPRTKTIGILSGCAILLFAVSAWLIVWAGEDYGMYGFPPLLIGIVLLFMALALIALRVINQRHQTPPGPHSS